MAALPNVRKWLRENHQLLAFLLLLGVFRTAVADWNPIPSGSMHPTLLEGDVVFVDRLAYDVKIPLTDVVLAHTGAPARGDIVTFASPKDGERLIKRVIGLPGDTVAMHDKRLFISGREVRYQKLGAASEPYAPEGVKALEVEEDIPGRHHRIQWLLAHAPQDDFGPITIPPDRYLVLGDNRDNSEDSRFIGLVPREAIIGRAECILVSLDYKGTWRPRFERFGHSLR